MALLELKNLKTFFATKRGTVKAVNGVSYSLDAGKVLGVVGESGSGKSVSAMSILRLLDGNGYIDSGEILFNGRLARAKCLEARQKPLQNSACFCLLICHPFLKRHISIHFG